MSGLKDPRVRKYVYGISIAALPLLIAAGVLSESVVPSVIAFIGAVLVPGLAVANTPTDPGSADDGS